MGLTAAEIAGLRAAAAAYLYSAPGVGLLVATQGTNALGEPLPATYAVAETVPGRLGRPSARNPFLAGRPVEQRDLVLTLPWGTDLTGVAAFDIEGAIYEPIGGTPVDMAAGSSEASAVFVMVRRTDLVAQGSFGS